MILSVVMPTCNKCRQLARTLAALNKQVVPGEWETVVIDDGSSDSTPEILREFSARPGWKLRVVQPGRNVGRAAARNLGIETARGRWILFLDDDIIAPPGLLAAHVDRLEANPGCGTIGRVATDPALVDAPHFHYMDSRGIAKIDAGTVPARYFVTQNAAVPREDLQRVGGFDEAFSAYGFEDADLAFRLQDRFGTEFLPVQQPIPLHVHHHRLDQYLAKKRECGRCALPLLARRHPGRLTEMRLHLVTDPPGGPVAPWTIRSLRPLLSGPTARFLTALVSRWPTRPGFRPLFARLFFLAMDALILCHFRLGLAEAHKQLPK
jgi:glycosyltransferase involved in cell wall biosynthesis